jgi:hypothetical protein
MAFPVMAVFFAYFPDRRSAANSLRALKMFPNQRFVKWLRMALVSETKITKITLI